MRFIYLLSGFGLCGLGILGAFLPVMPSTIFFILALPCFAKSSPRMESWLLNHPRFGIHLRAWAEDKSITAKNKAIAVLMLCVSISATAIFWVHKTPIRIMLAATAVLVSVYILSRKTRIESSDCDRA